MKHTNRKTIVSAVVLALALVVLLAGCASPLKQMVDADRYEAVTEETTEMRIGGEAGMYTKPMDMGGAYVTESEGAGSLYDSSMDGLYDENRKLIRTGDLTLETLQFEETLEKIQQAVRSVGGYVTDSARGGKSQRWASVVCRVPADQFHAFLETFPGEQVVSVSESAQDVTTQYVDVEARIDSLRQHKARLEKLAEECGSLEELLMVEEKLEYVLYELDQYQRQQKLLDQQVTYATWNIQINEVVYLTPDEDHFGDRVQEAFYHMFTGLGEGAENLVIALIRALPLLVFLALGGAVTLICVKRHKKRRSAPPAEPAHPKEEK